jgi:hypothetical protein
VTEEELPDSDPRVQAYASALRVVGPWKPENLARAVIKVADKELDELRAEVESLHDALTSAALETYTPDGSERFVTAFLEQRRELEDFHSKNFASMTRINRAERVAENAVMDKAELEARLKELS